MKPDATHSHPQTALGLHRWRLTAFSYLLLGVSLYLFKATGQVDSDMPLLAVFGLLAAGHLSVYLLIKQGWSRLFADPSMSAAQMVQAITAITAMIHYSGPMRGAMLCLYFVVMVNGILVLKHTTQFLIAGYAVGSLIILHLYEWHFSTVSGNEIAQLVVLGIGLVWFCYVGGFMYQLQRQSREQKNQLRIQQHQLADSNTRLQIALKHVEEIASKDPLTGAYNRRYFMEQLDIEIDRAQRHGHPLPLVVIDLDHFKQINDQYGHSIGDQVLQLFVTTTQHILRKHDCLARFGGEEFVALFPQTEIHGAQKILQRLQNEFREQTGQLPLDHPPTFSVGLALLRQEDSAQSLLQRADIALYQAKDNGRNQVAIAETGA